PPTAAFSCRLQYTRASTRCYVPHIVAESRASTAGQPPKHRSLVDALDDRRDTLAAADAERGEAVFAAALAQLVREREQKARPRRAERVPERDRPAVHVGPVPVEAEILLHREVLRRERLVDLDQ